MKSNSNSFVICRLPNASTYLFTNHHANSTHALIEFVSFDQQKNIIIRGDSWQTIHEEKILSIQLPLENNLVQQHSTKEQYINLVAKTKNALVKNDWKKIVISRKKTIHKKNISTDYFLKISNKFPEAFCYLVYENSENCWIGATPELLCKAKENEIETMALAGTLPNDDCYNWSDKEKQEHELVIEDISKKLKPWIRTITIDKTIEWKLAQLKHLKTTIKATISKDCLVENIINSLHPTSAVCGMPLEETKQFIEENESHEREFYTGYIQLNFPEETYAFVNLRCAKLYYNGLEAFVGGGIIPTSEAEKEWHETELKAFSISNI